MLRTIIGDAESKQYSVFLHFKKPTADQIVPDKKNLNLNKLMQNVGGEQFDYDTFKNLYDTDERVKTMVKNFDQQGLELKLSTDNDLDQPQQDATGDNTVSQMAKRATDLG